MTTVAFGILRSLKFKFNMKPKVSSDTFPFEISLQTVTSNLEHEFSKSPKVDLDPSFHFPFTLILPISMIYSPWAR